MWQKEEASALEIRALQHALDQKSEDERKLIEMIEQAQTLNYALEERQQDNDSKYADATKQIKDMQSRLSSVQKTVCSNI